MNAARLLLVEDDPTVRELVTHHLEQAGFAVVAAESAEAAWPHVEDADLLVLDWMLPGESGVELLARLRAGPHARKPVLMLTARAQEAARVEGLERGADDYLTKPFSAAELVARVRALIRRVRPPERTGRGALTIDLDRAEASWHGRSLALTRREFELLTFLVQNPGRVFSRGELLDRVWGEEFFGTERTVDQHVAQLRALLGRAAVETVRGRGYRLGELEGEAADSRA
ncbi:MAG: response regulator transcription factor [Trueperaceae bacterium]